MIAVDTNVLVAAHRRDAELHERAAAAVASLAEGPDAWAIPWSCIHEFLSIVTHPRIFATPSTVVQAFAQVDAWCSSPTIVLLGERSDHLGHLRALVGEGGVTGPRIHDARVAAVCLAHGVACLWSADRDFGRFPRLRVANPLVA